MPTLFVDASALVAMTTGEKDGDDLIRTMSGFGRRLSSPIAIWEAATAVARKRIVSPDEAGVLLEEFLATFGIGIIPIGIEEAQGALEAWRRFGKASRHPAALNMGDCFAYACAKTKGARLLYKGNDFSHTDLA